jgi:hypothetical protein
MKKTYIFILLLSGLFCNANQAKYNCCVLELKSNYTNCENYAYNMTSCLEAASDDCFSPEVYNSLYNMYQGMCEIKIRG